MNQPRKQNNSIWPIVIAFWLFFPVGFVLLYLRLKEKHGKYIASTKILYWTGVVLLALGVFYLGGSTGEENYVTSYVPASIFVFLLPGAILFYLGNKKRKNLKVYNQYLSYVNSRAKVNIDDLCNQLKVGYDMANQVLTDMISKGMIDGYISDNELILRGKEENPQAIPIKVANKETNKETKIVKCRECGAKNTVIVGEKNECEYCGSLLS